MRTNVDRTVLVLALSAFVVSGAGVAYVVTTAAPTAPRPGPGTATAGSPTDSDAVLLQQVGRNRGFYPGGPAQALTVTAHNPAAFDQVVGEVTVTLAGTAACPSENWQLLQVADDFGLLPARTTSAPQRVATLRLLETGGLQDGCKDAVVDLTFASAAGE